MLIVPHFTLGTCSVHTASDLIVFTGHCDLYFMVQCFCLVSTVSNMKASYFGYLFLSDTVNDLILLTGHCDLYFMVQ